MPKKLNQKMKKIIKRRGNTQRSHNNKTKAAMFLLSNGLKCI